MATRGSSEVESTLPGLIESDYDITSPRDRAYNCIAWAAGQSDAWWWPDPTGQYYWPASVPRQESVDAFVAAFGSLGYVQCDDEQPETGFDRVALFARAGTPTHAARQLRSGLWTSKLGQDVDIIHSLRALEGDRYGTVATVMKRPAD